MAWSLEDEWAGATKDHRSFQGSELKATESPQLLNLHHQSVSFFFFLSLLLRIDWCGVLLRARRIRVKEQTAIARFKVAPWQLGII